MEMKGRKAIICIILLSLLCFALVGCGSKRYTRDEINKYLSKEYPGEEINVTVLEENKLWSCHFEDMPEVEFSLINAHYQWGGISYYKINSSASEVFWQHYLNQYLQDIDDMSEWTIDEYSLKFYYSDKSDLVRAGEQIGQFRDWYKLQLHSLEFAPTYCYLTNMELPERFIEGYLMKLDVSDQPDNAELLAYDKMAEGCEAVLKRYYSYYCLESPDFTAEELSEFADLEWGWGDFFPESYEIDWYGEPLAYETFTGIGISGSYLYGWHISYGSLYGILKRLGIDVEGTPEHFKTVGNDGKIYEFSNSFKEEKGAWSYWYYYCDGDRKNRDGATNEKGPVLSLFEEDFKQVTGIEVYKRSYEL